MGIDECHNGRFADLSQRGSEIITGGPAGNDGEFTKKGGHACMAGRFMCIIAGQ